ncbi:hypothetical protein AB0D90_21670 [Streptomyces althioticus]|uniref:hypothetical protein n=1 Tax=Streptomyces althioticus TaxID=83380 RepID=UPI0033C2BAF7
MPLIDVAPGHTRLFLSKSGVAERLGISRNHIGRLITNNLFASPDVWVAKYLVGWDQERIVQFGKDIGVLDDNGQRRLDPETGKPVPITGGSRTGTDRLRTIVKESYSKTPALYLGAALIADVYEVAQASIYINRSRERFIPADVAVDTRFGWDEERVIEYGRQTGRFKSPDRPEKWAVERTTIHGLPAADWATDTVIAQGADAAAQVVAALKEAGHNVPRRLANAA